ncbi:MAG: ABC transporter permease subunit [Anaerolineales bacterium]|nr:ABC transporter permease subunit [Anaerolineales bacterium]
MKKNKPSLLRSLGSALGVLLVVVVFAYGVKVTDVNFETTRSEDRLISLKRVIRALVKPDIVEYKTVDTDIEFPFYLPCPDGQNIDAPEQDTSQAYMTASAYCASPKESVIINGYNFTPNAKGPINFVTATGVNKQLGNFEADANGYFEIEVEIPTRQPVAEAQLIRATARVQIGGPKLTETAIVTWDKIIETVFMALLATAIGTAVAIPVSFLAARNLMAENKSPLTSIAFSLIGWPIGIFLGIQAAKWIRTLLIPLTDNSLSAAGGLIAGVILVYLLLRWSVNPADTEVKSTSEKALQLLAILLAGLLSVASLICLETISKTLGKALIEPLGSFGFLGNFIFQMGEVSNLLIPAFTALIAGAAVGSSLGKIGQTISDKSSPAVVKAVNLVTAALAGAVLFALIGAGIDWLYQIGNFSKTLYWPTGIGAVIGIILALITSPKQALPTGLVIYGIVRTILNGTRSVESLVMAIVFVIWVGIGPFAGSLALALHTLAALAKLYSEQVESILPGPLEAIQATGANRLQTIVYAVVPQIVSPYISFTMYRWDINVRMSTIIGFVGGGGIGFLLQQNINLLDYRAASVQMVAIAVVVASMDYISSVVRERMV